MTSPDLTPNRPDVEAIADDALWAAMDAYLDADPDDAKVSRERMSAALTAALPLLNEDTLRQLPQVQALMAEAWDTAVFTDYRLTGLTRVNGFRANPYRPDTPNPYRGENP